jgi:hypothetical protein
MGDSLKKFHDAWWWGGASASVEVIGEPIDIDG